MIFKIGGQLGAALQAMDAEEDRWLRARGEQTQDDFIKRIAPLERSGMSVDEIMARVMIDAQHPGAEVTTHQITPAQAAAKRKRKAWFDAELDRRAARLGGSIPYAEVEKLRSEANTRFPASVFSKVAGDQDIAARRKSYTAAHAKPSGGVLPPPAASKQEPAWSLPQRPQFAGPSAHLAQQPSAPPPSAAVQASPAASIAHNQQRFRQGADALRGKMQEARQQFQKGLSGVSSWFSGQRRAVAAPPQLPKNGPTPLPPVQTSGRTQAPGRPAVASAATFTKPDGTVVMPPRGQPRTAATLGASATPRGVPSAKEIAARGRDAALLREGGLESPATPGGPRVFNNNDPHGEFQAPKPQPPKMPAAGAGVDEWRRYTRGI